MFFPASKILGFFALPSNLVIVVGLLGVLLLLTLTRFKRTGRALMLFSLLVLAILGWSPIGNLLTIPLEERFPGWAPGKGEIAGIIVLGGGVTANVSEAHGEPALNEAGERFTAAATLARKYPQAKIVFSGGGAGLIRSLGVEAAWARRLLRDLGVPEDRLVLEDRSRNTFENLWYSREIIRARGWRNPTLVTLDLYTRRAVATARKQGWGEFFWVSALAKGEPAHGYKALQTYSRLTIFWYEVVAMGYSKLRGWV